MIEIGGVVVRSLLRSGLIGLALASAWLEPACAAVNARINGEAAEGFGRIRFAFEQAVHARLRNSNGILVLDFDAAVKADLRKLPAELSQYISVARLDPDGKAVRFALKSGFQTSLLEAGDQIFLDILPSGWAGLPPGLPQDVVNALSKRAIAAEEKLRQVQRDSGRREPKDLVVKVAHGPGFTRLIFPLNSDIPIEFDRSDDTAALAIGAPLRFDVKTIKPDIGDVVQDIRATLDDGVLRVILTAPASTAIRGGRDDDGYVLDIVPPKAEKLPQKVETPKKEVVAAADAEKLPVPTVKLPVAAEPEPVAAPAPVDLKPIRPTFEKAGNSLRIAFPFGVATPAAAFQRAGTVWLVFENRQGIETITLPDVAREAVSGLTSETTKGETTLKLQLVKPSLLNFAAQGKSWVATIGENGLEAAASIGLNRSVSNEGRTTLNARLAGAGAVHWLLDTESGDRLAVVTALGPPRGLPKAQSFVEARALQSAHGLVISPNADDLIVTSGLDDATIGRSVGLTLSPVNAAQPGDALAVAGRDSAIDSDVWTSDSAGDIRIRQVALMREAADASKRDRSDARLRLARFYLANGLYPEAANVLQTLRRDDEAAATTKRALSAALITAVLRGRYAEAQKILAMPTVMAEPESALWKAVIDAKQGRNQPALVEFRRNLDLIDRYPDGLAVMLRPLVIEAALDGDDATFANGQIDRLEGLEQVRPDANLVALERGRVAVAQGRDQDGLTYLNVAAKGTRPIEAAARLELVLLKLKMGAIEKEAAIAELETISAIWRGDEIEVRALSRLGDLYAEGGRWREAFAAAQRAVLILPNHPLTRGLQDKMAKAFSAIFLDGKDSGLTKVESLGLYYDYKSYTPPGRDGDEMIRNLAERLVGLDLLDQASELLKYQIDTRVEGVGRAQVAARLAVIHLLNHKPNEAIDTLRSTRATAAPRDLKRARALLEARAMSDLSQTDGALELLAPQSGDDADVLRADILWRGKRWRDAAEAFELVLGERWSDGEPLSNSERADVLRAGISYVLADDRIGLDRLRSKYATKMSDSADARTFSLVTGAGALRGDQFRALARSVISVDTLNDFLARYRKRYGDIAGKPRDVRLDEAAGGGKSVPANKTVASSEKPA